jgi:predicted transcriptional regulator
MRTTLTIEDDVAKLLESICKRRNTSLKVVINEALRQGLSDMTKPPQRGKPYETRSVNLGRYQLANLDDISEVLAAAEADTFK